MFNSSDKQSFPAPSPKKKDKPNLSEKQPW